MNTIKIYLAESGRIADLHKDFPLYQGQFQDKLLNVYVPTSILAPQFDVQHYIGQISGAVAPTTEELNAFVLANTYPQREASQGDIIEFFNTTSLLFYVYTYNGTAWVSDEVNSFGTLTTIAGTSVKVGMVGVQRNGSMYKSKSYFMRYLKTLTYQGVEYALYERKLPKEFTSLVGQGANAPTIIANVVNVDTETNHVISIITSQTCKLDVMASTMLDNDTTIEPSELENLEAQVNANSASLLLKQNIIDNGLLTTQKTVVGAINEVKSTADTNTIGVYNNTQDIVDIKAEQITQNQGISANTENITANTNNISDLQGRVATLEEQVTVEEHYVGQMTGSTLPTDLQLNVFVITQTGGQQPQGGEVVIFILTIPDETDKIYKYTYSSFQNEWSYYEIPAAEPASNTSKGIVKGSYSSGTTQKTQVNITNGEIEDIYIVDGTSTKRRLAEYLNTDSATLATTTTKALQNEQDIATASGKITTLETSVGNILNGTTSVPKATNATNDGLGNNIASTYLTTSAGVTKVQMADYALPRTFNDVSFFTSTGYDDEVSTSATPIHTLTTTAVGDFEVFSAEKAISNATFQLANKNSYVDTIFASASILCNVQFRLTTEIYVDNAWVTANIELTDEINMAAGQIKKLSFGSTLNSLSGVYTLADGNKIRQTLDVITETSSEIEFSIYSNDVYPSTFYLNTTSQTIILAQGEIGELPVYNLIGSGDSNKVTFTLPVGTPISNNVQALFILQYSGTTNANTQLELSYNSQAIQIIVPANNGTNTPATIENMISKYAPNANKLVFTGIFNIVGGTISVIADVDAQFNPVTDVQIDNTSIVSNTVANLATINSNYNSSSNKLATASDLPANITINTTNESISDGTNTLNIVTTDTVQNINASKAFGNVVSFDDEVVLANNKPVYAKTSGGAPRSILALSSNNHLLLNRGLNTDSLIISSSSILPSIEYDNTLDLGGLGLTWKDIYLKGLLRDSANNDYGLKIPSTSGWTANKTIATTDQIPATTSSVTENSTDALTSGGAYTALSGKQNTLTAGSNISISGDVISATDTTYSSLSASENGTDVSLVTTGEKYTWNNKQNALSSAQINAVDSGIDATKVGQIATNTGDISTINGKIPSQATSLNQLADKDFVNSSINALAAFYITRTAGGDSFNTYAQLSAATTFYSGGASRIPTQNDYTYVQWDENKGDVTTGYTSFTTTSDYIGHFVIYNNEGVEVTSANKDSLGITAGTTVAYDNLPTTRYSYQGGTYPSGQWEFQLIVNNSALTAAQIAAINSGITNSLVTKLNGIETGAEVNDLTDVQINGTSIVSSKVANFLTKTAYNASTNKIVTESDLPANITITTTSGSQSVSDGTNTLSFGANAFNSTAIPATTSSVTQNSTAALTSGGAYTALSGKQDSLPTTSTAGNVLKSTSTAGTVEWGTLSASDVGALPSNTTYVSSVNGSSGAITNIATLSDIPTIPTTSTGGQFLKSTSTSGTLQFGTGLPYTTTAPTAANTDGLKLVVLTSEPATRYSGWIYIITE